MATLEPDTREGTADIHVASLLFRNHCGRHSLNHVPFASPQGSFYFDDGLKYEPGDEWTYCNGKDNRMFHTETKEGLKPAGQLGQVLK